MSTPVNHHYVSECHLKEFYNKEEKNIYLFDKELINFYKKAGTKYIFSLENLNTRFENDNLDKSSMELELRVMFEENFSKHLQSVKRLYSDNSLVKDVYEDLNYLALMALIGEYRNPNYKSGLDQALESLDEQLIARGAIIPKQIIHSEVLYKNLRGYIDAAFLMFEKMDPITFAIVSIKSDDHFLIPDTSGFLVRSNQDYGPVVQFGLPVSDKLFILGRSVAMGHYPTSLVEINDNDNEVVFRINSDLANYAYKTIGCRDETFLKKTIQKIGQIGLKGQYFSNSTIGSPESDDS